MRKIIFISISLITQIALAENSIFQGDWSSTCQPVLVGMDVQSYRVESKVQQTAAGLQEVELLRLYMESADCTGADNVIRTSHYKIVEGVRVEDSVFAVRTNLDDATEAPESIVAEDQGDEILRFKNPLYSEVDRSIYLEKAKTE